ncbi:hypothetical protein ATCC51562_1472 [Campylobacter concisus ATCC 51562]|uniref:Uncharacterized protein n=1 Tax=Campylobacter concisus ATCC 51562 TaxID=1242969 RepID=U2GBY1_9BACT|nr:hypothetical protein ATCC51562_1472 [Campylobacter concisus ATCC 51562]
MIIATATHKFKFLLFWAKNLKQQLNLSHHLKAKFIRD